MYMVSSPRVLTAATFLWDFTVCLHQLILFILGLHCLLISSLDSFCSMRRAFTLQLNRLESLVTTLVLIPQKDPFEASLAYRSSWIDAQVVVCRVPSAPLMSAPKIFKLSVAENASTSQKLDIRATGANVSIKPIPGRCQFPSATNRALNLIIYPYWLDFKHQTHMVRIVFASDE